MGEPAAENIFFEVKSGLRQLGYRDSLLAEEYKFVDWFSNSKLERKAGAVAFAQTPISYDTACIGVVKANGTCGSQLIDSFRALGTPTILEINSTGVNEWAVAASEGAHGLIDRYPANRINDLFARRADVWEPSAFLRAKNIGSFTWARQMELFSGLVPELESQIQEKMDPLLRDALSHTKSVYRKGAGVAANPGQLFKLIFWLLTAKVFHDRGVGKFAHFSESSEVDDVIRSVADQYKSVIPRLLNKESRAAAYSRIWHEMDFRNLSVEVLAQIWSTTLVDDQVRKELGIHRTSRSIVRYIVERTPFNHTGDDKRIILEPCCGSGVFLIGAMNELRHKLFGASSAERHKYYVKHLAGIEKDAFGVEISKLALTLADFPNPDGWDIEQGDVFATDKLPSLLKRAGVVFCNPPFEDFDPDIRSDYNLTSVIKPAELLLRVLEDLHPSGVLGFVLPRGIIDRPGYRLVRQRLAERFARIEMTLLPDRAFEADSEIAVLIATQPVPHSTCEVINRVVDDKVEAWKRFESTHLVSSENTAERTISEVAESLAIVELSEVWECLRSNQPLEKCADLHRGIEWNEALTEDGVETGNRSRFIKQSPTNGFMKGVAPRTTFSVFEKPQTPYLDMRPQNQRGSSYQNDWKSHKVIVNKARRSRGAWRMAAFPDQEGIACYQTFIAIWPKPDCYDVVVLSAILNGPLANAFVATREKRDIKIETLLRLPLPYLSESQQDKIRKLVHQYQSLNSGSFSMVDSSEKSDLILKKIDAEVLDGYHLPARLEHKLLELFQDAVRPTPFEFAPYLLQGEDVYFSLSERLSNKFNTATASSYLKRVSVG
ncbi:MAG: SAM-dependent DNA methyltransferase [Burkholderiales bacterium]|nr:SAM-dependent DNA methyltransferase [Phycisphaerae bacterium]